MMDGVHDLGGKQGFGPIAVHSGDQAFPNAWEERMWILARSPLLQGTDVTIDWFRHTLERMVPSDYLSYAYFNKWCTTYLALLIDAGVFSLEEVLRGKSANPPVACAARSAADLIETNRGSDHSFAVETEVPPAFAVGDTVQTKRRVAAAHTRLPAYATNAQGRIIAHHGAYVLPDRSAAGQRVGEHLYTVAFAAIELWGDATNPNDSVTLDLWESYFVSP